MAGTEHVDKRAQQATRAPSVADTLPTVPVAPVRRAAVLEVGSVHDPAEQQADLLADRAIARLRAEHAEDHAPDVAADRHHAPVRRAAAPVVGRAGGPAPQDLSARIESMRGRGRALDADVRRDLGGAFGRDFGGVRVHTDDHAAGAAAQLGALAFTTGQDIFFGAGQYRPDTEDGRHVLAHELAHTVQQQGSARRKVSRLWDLTSDEGTDLTQAAKIAVQAERLVMFVKDDSGDTMVVKRENQPIGLAQLAGDLHQKLNGTETIQYRKLPKRARGTLQALLGIDNLLDQPSWTKRGNAERIATGWRQITDPVQRGVQSVKEELAAFPNSELLAMSVAPGEGADKANERTADSKQSLRSLLERPGHVRQLGRMTAIDMLLGNGDRVLSGNLGNWFYTPAGSMVMLDNVDGGGTMATDTRSGTVVTDLLRGLSKSKLKDTAEDAVGALRSAMSAADRTTGTWFDATLRTGGTRKAHFEAEMLAGLIEGKKEISKVFTSTRWTIGGGKRRAIKKAIKAEARATAAQDADDNGESPYFEVLKARAAWLAKN